MTGQDQSVVVWRPDDLTRINSYVNLCFSFWFEHTQTSEDVFSLPSTRAWCVTELGIYAPAWNFLELSETEVLFQKYSQQLAQPGWRTVTEIKCSTTLDVSGSSLHSIKEIGSLSPLCASLVLFKMCTIIRLAHCKKLRSRYSLLVLSLSFRNTCKGAKACID